MGFTTVAGTVATVESGLLAGTNLGAPCPIGSDNVIAIGFGTAFDGDAAGLPCIVGVGSRMGFATGMGTDMVKGGTTGRTTFSGIVTWIGD
jgi:hypothetical protein